MTAVEAISPAARSILVRLNSKRRDRRIARIIRREMKRADRAGRRARRAGEVEEILRRDSTPGFPSKNAYRAWLETLDDSDLHDWLKLINLEHPKRKGTK